MKRRVALVAAPLLLGATQPTLVPDVSPRQVNIIYSFTGADLLLFGAIVHPPGREDDRRTDVAVVLKGPTQSVLVREKRKLAGLIWANADAMRFRSAPGYYAVASSRPLDTLIDERTAAIYELGLSNIHLSPASGEPPPVVRRFEDGYVARQRRAGLYAAQVGNVEINDGVLYRARLTIPARVPVGRYTAETFLIRDGKVIAAATRDVDIRKSGFERFVALTAARWPLTYGVAAVALSIALGWAGGALFRRS